MRISDTPIVALDLETGGLTPGKHTPLAIGAVWLDSPRLPVDETNSFYAQLEFPLYVTTPDAMRINKLDLANPPGPQGTLANRSYPVEEAMHLFKQWLSTRLQDRPIHALGMNVGSFDLPMLRSIWQGPWPFHYRSIDLNSLFFALSQVQNKPYSAVKEEVVKQAWAKSEFPGMEHNALADAWMAVHAWDECIRQLTRNGKDVGEHMRYLGVLSLLGDCSEMVDGETRESIDLALTDAARNIDNLEVKTRGNRVWVELTDVPRGD